MGGCIEPGYGGVYSVGHHRHHGHVVNLGFGGGNHGHGPNLGFRGGHHGGHHGGGHHGGGHGRRH